MQVGEFAGQWWLPDSPSRAAPGRLYLSQEMRPRLSLSGQITEPDADRDVFRSLFGRERKVGHLHGRTTRGVDVTLGDCRLSVDEMEWDHPEAATYTIVSAAAYLGAHLEPETVRFQELSLDVQRLVDWIGPPPVEMVVQPRLSRPERIRIDAMLPPKVILEIEGGRLEIAQSLDVSGDRRLRAGIARKAAFRVSSDRPLLIAEWFGRYIGPLSRLVSISAGVHLAPESVQLRHGGEERWVDVVWPHPLNTELPEGPVSAVDLLFMLSDLGPEPSARFRSWLGLSAAYGPVLDSFFATRSGAHMYEEDRFSNLVQAAEGFHRRKMGGRPPSARAEARRSEIVSATPERYRKWLSRALKYTDEYPLDQRIAGLISAHPWLIGDAIPAQYRDWSLLASKTRNARAHHDPDAPSVGTWELIGLARRLETVLEVCLLREIGFDEDEIQEMVQRSSRPYRIIKLNDL